MCSIFFLYGSFVQSAEFVSDYAKPLLDKWWPGDEKAYSFNINQDNRFIDNVKALFYPSDEGVPGWQIWVFIRTIAVAVFFALLVWAWFQFIFNADNPEWINKAKMSLLYILLWAAVFFLSRWILTELLSISSIDGVYESDDNNSLVDRANNIAVLILSFLKAIAFFVALFFIVWYGFQIMSAMGEEEKIKAARQGLLNVVLALIFIKIIDYLYYIALSGDFTNQAIDFIVQASRFLTYIIGVCFVLALLYAGYTMLTSSGDEERTTKAKNIVKAVFVIGLLVLLFMLIIHQIFQDLYS
jgi:hypothetical protein